MLGGGTSQGAVGKKQQFLWLEAGMGDEDEKEIGREQETPSDWESGRNEGGRGAVREQGIRMG